MKYYTHNQLPIDTGLTSLVGRLRCSYQELVAQFGKPLPTGKFDHFKSDAEWHIKFEAGSIVATIYNWKNGRNYLGPDGPAVEDIRDWLVGGRHALALEYVRDVVQEDVTGMATALPLP